MSLVVGVVGLNGAGKSVAVKHLAARHGFHATSLSDAIRRSLAAQGVEASRANMIDEGNRLRRTHGAGVLGQRTADEVLAPGRSTVVDSVRHPAEVAALKSGAERLGLAFALVEVHVPLAVRWERVVGRARDGEETTLEAFERSEKEERNQKESSGQQVDAVRALATVRPAVSRYWIGPHLHLSCCPLDFTPSPCRHASITAGRRRRCRISSMLSLSGWRANSLGIEAGYVKQKNFLAQRRTIGAPQSVPSSSPPPSSPSRTPTAPPPPPARQKQQVQ